MKKLKYFFLPALGILAFVTMGHIVRSTGSPGGKTGSPGDQAKTCTDCHGGAKAADKPGWITTDIPMAGYRPEAEYTITVRGEHPTATAYGFELTAEKAGSIKTGGFDKAGNNQVQLLSGTNAVTHTSSGTIPATNAKSWTMKWKAPPAGTGSITFYASVNAANGDSGTAGDAIFVSKLAIVEQDLSSIDQTEQLARISFFPNPATDQVTVEINGMDASRFSLALYTISGQRVIDRQVEPQPGTNRVTLNVSELPDGTYFAVLSAAKRVAKSKLVISR
jgi:hypothetical protein